MDRADRVDNGMTIKLQKDRVWKNHWYTGGPLKWYFVSKTTRNRDWMLINTNMTCEKSRVVEHSYNNLMHSPAAWFVVTDYNLIWVFVRL